MRLSLVCALLVSNVYCTQAIKVREAGDDGKSGQKLDLLTQNSAELMSLQKKLTQMNQMQASSLFKRLDSSLEGKSSAGWTPHEPLLPGVMPGTSRPHIILAQDVDWPPYAYLGIPPESNFETAGIGHDVAKGLSSVCDIDVSVVQTSWGKCWASGEIGEGLLNGYYHGCMTYTHTAGQRPRYMEFSNAFLKDNKPAGLLTRLDASGNPVVSPTSDLSGVTVVDVNGWAPTADTLAMVTNPCTGNLFAGYTMITPESTGNDAAMSLLMSGEADAMWVYADQAHVYNCYDPNVTATWNCSLWTGLGTKFAYIQTGLFGHAINGTTLAISKKGAGLASIINPCLQAYMQTEDYYTVCNKHGLADTCYTNSYFPNSGAATPTWEMPTNELTTACADGYCPCAAR